MRPEQGFTLVEMVVAVAIFGIIASVAYQTLETSLETRARVAVEYRQWREIARAMAAIQRDVEAIEQRPVRLSTDRLAPPLVGAPVLVRSEQPVLALTRGGDPLATGRAIAPRRVGYRVREGALELLTWSALDQAAHSSPEVTVLASGLADIVVRYRDVAGRWEQVWPPGGTVPVVSEERRSAVPPAPLPAGVEVTLVLASGQRVTRVFPVPVRSES